MRKFGGLIVWVLTIMGIVALLWVILFVAALLSPAPNQAKAAVATVGLQHALEIGGVWYWATALVMAVWVGWDSIRRHCSVGATFGWALAMIAFFPIALPCYLGTRPLLAGEKRAGGRPWNVLKHCVVIWTISLPVFLVYGAFSSAVHISFLRTELERAGGIAGMSIGLVFEVGVWLCGLAVAFGLGFFLRKPDLVELGSARPEEALAPPVEKPAGREPV